MTLQEHLQLRQRYPGVRLLWSGDWSTFSAPDFWVTVAGITYADSAGALAWCRYQGFDRDHCAAKFISTTHPVAAAPHTTDNCEQSVAKVAVVQSNSTRRGRDICVHIGRSTRS